MEKDHCQSLVFAQTCTGNPRRGVVTQIAQNAELVKFICFGWFVLFLFEESPVYNSPCTVPT
eukprot:6479519-Amphidinium_carterae.1